MPAPYRGWQAASMVIAFRSSAFRSGAGRDRKLLAFMPITFKAHPRWPSNGDNARNGSSPKTVQTEQGPVELAVPRDRAGTVEPTVVKKRQRRLEGFDGNVLALYAHGLTTRDIQGHLEE